MEFPTNTTIIEMFDNMVEKYPNKVAVTYENKEVTYSEIYQSSCKIADGLRARGVLLGDCIAIAAEKSITTIESILGVLRAGGTYIPIELEIPNERINYILKSSNTKLFLSNEVLGKAEEILVPNIKIEDLEKTEKTYSVRTENIKSTNLAYVMYTSGSTGSPKGVMITHKNVLRLVKNSNYLNFNKINILQAGSLAFDASTFEIWGALLNGGCLHLISKEDLLNVKKVKKVINKNKINALFLTASLFNQLILDDITLLDNVEFILIGGDKLSEYHVGLLRKHNKKLRSLMDMVQQREQLLLLHMR